MRIQDSNLNSVTIGTSKSGKADGVQSGRSGSAGASGSSGTDRISLSDLGSLVRSVSGDTPERTAKVSHLAAAYKSGNYHAPSTAVAKGIVNDAHRTG
jgi:anti-sigma28 factor (negative regulator of flagellin synthesis)